MVDPMRLLIAGEFRWNCGSSHVVKEYIRFGSKQGLDIRVATAFGKSDAGTRRELHYCDDLAWATHLLVIFEGNPFLTESDLSVIERHFPRSKRTVIDADGHWSPLIQVGTDNNGRPCGAASWRGQIEAISDVILQPCLTSATQGASPFPYFGMPEECSAEDNRYPKDVDVQYVGANWFRYPALAEVFEAARAALGAEAALQVLGTYWDGTSRPGFEDGTTADVDRLATLQVRCGPSVPFGSVIDNMSRSRISPVLVRPVLSAMKMLTPRMFETLAAHTIPIYRSAERYIGDIWKDDGVFCGGSNLCEAILRLSDRAGQVDDHLRELRHQMRKTYGYEVLVRQLAEIMSSR